MCPATLRASVASRQEEKERRRQERLEREQAEKRAAARRKRLQFVLGGLLAAAAIAGVVLVLVVGVGGGGGGGGDEGEPAGPSEEAANVELPQQQIGDVQEAAKAAGCKLASPEIEGATHETREFGASDFKTNPPTSGNHFPEWYDDGIYNPGDVPQLGMLVHTLEHGRINVQYKPGTPRQTVLQLEALLGENEGYHQLLYENTTGMDAAIAATAWGQSLTCPEMNDKVFDAIRTFRNEYTDRGPETVP
jgi:hypothetical protein